VKILVINGNTNASITNEVERTGRQVAFPGTEVVALTPNVGPPTVEGYLDGQLSALGVCEAIAAHQVEADAFVIACFSDPGLYAAREFSVKPVVGIAQASMITAIQLGYRFGLLSPQPRLRPVLEGLVRYYGFQEHFGGIWTINQSVAEVVNSGNRLNIFLKAAQCFVQQADVQVLILAGAVFSGLDVAMSQHLGKPVLDPVKCAIIQAQGLVLLPTNVANKTNGLPLSFQSSNQDLPTISALIDRSMKEKFSH
jgi:allantoin racemase